MRYEPTTDEESEHQESAEEVRRLLALMARLRGPDGCPWDQAQTLESLRPYLLEETYEVLEAIDHGDDHGHLEELGDLLLQIVFHAELAREDGRWTMAEVARGITDKLYVRHPHVFGDADAGNADEALQNWEQIKAKEKAAAGKARKSVLDGVPTAAPALMRAERLGDKAASVGFDWPDRTGVRAKVDEELGELDAAIESGDKDAIAGELGDLLFTLANLARHLHVHPEDALRESAAKFSRRFKRVESALEADGEHGLEVGMERLEALWVEAKKSD